MFVEGSIYLVRDTRLYLVRDTRLQIPSSLLYSSGGFSDAREKSLRQFMTTKQDPIQILSSLLHLCGGFRDVRYKSVFSS